MAEEFYEQPRPSEFNESEENSVRMTFDQENDLSKNMMNGTGYRDSQNTTSIERSGPSMADNILMNSDLSNRQTKM